MLSKIDIKEKMEHAPVGHFEKDGSNLNI